MAAVYRGSTDSENTKKRNSYKKSTGRWTKLHTVSDEGGSKLTTAILKPFNHLQFSTTRKTLNNIVYLICDFDTTWGSIFRDLNHLFLGQFFISLYWPKDHKSIRPSQKSFKSIFKSFLFGYGLGLLAMLIWHYLTKFCYNIDLLSVNLVNLYRFALYIVR